MLQPKIFTTKASVVVIVVLVMSSALSVTFQFYVFISFRPLDILVQHIVHYLGVCCILLIEECATLILVLYIIYTGLPSFCLVHFMISTFGYLSFIWFIMSTPLYSVYLYYFILFCPLAKIILCILPSHAMSYFRIILLSSNCCLYRQLSDDKH